MKYCPICERKYDEEMRMCGVDGTPLKSLGGGDTVLDIVSGRMIKGRYRVLKKLGEGGMGAVYLADQVSIERKVALKLLQGAYAKNDEFIARFRREARLAASLNHRNIVTIYDFDQDSDDTLFIAMEYVDGTKLTDVIRDDGPLDMQRAVCLGVQIAEGLDAAHRQGVIHRDIKPDNIMVVGRDRPEEVKLMDFGIARLRDAGASSHITRTGMILGTPAYMAPEQAEGAQVSEQTDIYVLGIVLYEMLSGTVPFRASTPGALRVKHIQERPVGLRTLRREVPVEVERIVMQALEKRPDNRQRDMREIAHELKRVAMAEPSPKTIIAQSESGVPNVPQTIAATQISPPDSSNLTSFINNKHIAVALIGIVAVGTMALGVFKILDQEPSHQINKIPEIIAEPVRRSPEPVTDQVSLRAPRLIAPSPKVAKAVKSVSPPPTQSPLGSPKRAEKRVDSVNVQNQILREANDPQGGITDATKPTPALISEQNSLNVTKIRSHMRAAQNFRERGEYRDAAKELEKARAIDPNNREILAEIERTQRACNAERVLLGTVGTKC